MQGAQWNVPGPIASSLDAFYGIGPDAVQLLLNYGPIFYILTSIPFAWMMASSPRGLKQAVLAGIVLTAASAALRLACRGPDAYSVACMHASFILNAIAGPPGMAFVTQLTELWFEPSERGLATAIGVQANVVGGVLSFIAGPLMVDATSPTMRQFDAYNAIFVVACGANLLAAGVYFPEQPEHSPSLSAAFRERAAATRRMTLWSFWREHLALLRNGQFMLICVCCGLMNGMSSAWTSTLSITGAPYGLDATAAGWIGAIQSVAGNFGGLIACAVVDRHRNHKLVIMATLWPAAAALVWYALQTQGGVLPAAWTAGASGTVLLWVTAAASISLSNSSWPVFFDSSAEEAFPVLEATSLTLLTNVYNFGALLLLAVPLQEAGSTYTLIFVATFVVLTVVLQLCFRPRNNRRAVDDGKVDPAELLLLPHDEEEKEMVKGLVPKELRVAAEGGASPAQPLLLDTG